LRQSRERTRAAPTIYDVADRAGVSISTVSLALNSPDRVRPETLARVYAAVRDLGFVPKADAAVRARKGTRRIGVVAPFTAYGSFMERLQGVLAASDEDRFEIVVFNQEATTFRQHFVDSLPLSRRLDGIILMAVPISDGLVHRLIEDGLQTVLVELARPEFSSVSIDDEEGGRLAADYLIQRGHRRCAFLGEPPVSETMASELPSIQDTARIRGFREGLAKAGVPLRDAYVVTSGDPGGPRAAAHQLLDLPQPPTAIFAHSDDLAVGVLKVARERGLDVPRDLAVIGFDDREFAGHLGLTTIRQPLFDSGRIALKLLRDRMTDHPPVVPQAVRLPVTLVPRDTA
jgi:DNA-binding LacI/PurR family transcriptional regulator